MKSLQQDYKNLEEAIVELKRKGYVEEFEISKEGFLNIPLLEQKVLPKNAQVTEFHRFESETNPSSSVAVYAIQAQNGAKGLVFDETHDEQRSSIAEFMTNVNPL